MAILEECPFKEKGHGKQLEAVASSPGVEE